MRFPGRLFFVLATLAAGWAQADTIQVAVAANFTAPMKEIITAFEQQTGHVVKAAYGSTGKFYAQISNGAPFEALLAADETTPMKLVEDGLAIDDSRFTYAVGGLVLWSSREGFVDPEGKVLATGDFKKLAIANPKVAPYGATAIEVLNELGLLAQIEPKFVTGENIAQTYQFVGTGNAQLGFVALSQVMQDSEITAGSAWIIPGERHTPIRQDAVILNAGKDKAAVAELFDFLEGEPAKSIIRSFGYAI